MTHPTPAGRRSAGPAPLLTGIARALRRRRPAHRAEPGMLYQDPRTIPIPVGARLADLLHTPAGAR